MHSALIYLNTQHITLTVTADAVDLENDLQGVVQWFTVNNLRVNYKTSKVLSFSISTPAIDTSYSLNGSVIPKSMSLTDLGVILDSRWSFDERIRQIVGRCNKTLGFIKRITFKFISAQVIVHLYKFLILPILTFASI